MRINEPAGLNTAATEDAAIFQVVCDQTPATQPDDLIDPVGLRVHGRGPSALESVRHAAGQAQPVPAVAPLRPFGVSSSGI